MRLTLNLHRFSKGAPIMRVPFNLDNFLQVAPTVHVPSAKYCTLSKNTRDVVQTLRTKRSLFFPQVASTLAFHLGS